MRAPLIGRNGFAPSGDAKEHGVKLLHRAIAPFLDSTVVTIGKFRSMNGGHGSPLPSLGVVEHFRWSRLPQSENISRLVHILSEVWGCDSTVVTIGKFRSTNGGHGSIALIPWGGRALPVVETAPEREFLASRPYPLGSVGLSQIRRRCGPSPGADTPHRYRRRRLSCANRPGPSSAFPISKYPQGPLMWTPQGRTPYTSVRRRLPPPIRENPPHDLPWSRGEEILPPLQDSRERGLEVRVIKGVRVSLSFLKQSETCP